MSLCVFAQGGCRVCLYVFASGGCRHPAIPLHPPPQLHLLSPNQPHLYQIPFPLNCPPLPCTHTHTHQGQPRGEGRGLNGVDWVYVEGIDVGGGAGLWLMSQRR